MQKAIRFIAVAICCAIAVLRAGPAQAEKRVALVIGNSAYAHAPALRNPANDARAIAGPPETGGLRRGRPEARPRVRRDAAGAARLWSEHARRRGGGRVLRWPWAGAWGRELPGARRCRLEDGVERRLRGGDAERRLDAIRPASRLRLVILDACRVNPLAARMELAGGLTRSVPRGFGRIEPTGDVLVAYAAKGRYRCRRTARAGTAPMRRRCFDAGDARSRHPMVMGRVRDLVLAKTGGRAGAVRLRLARRRQCGLAVSEARRRDRCGRWRPRPCARRR